MMLFFKTKRNKFEGLTDELIISQFKLGNQPDILEFFFEKYGHLVFGVCLKYLSSKEAAEDMTITIFSELEKKIREHSITYFKGYLHALTKNECLMTLRKKKVLAVGIEALASEVEDEADLTKQKDLDKLLEQMISFMNSLSANQRLCIELFYFKKMGYQQIAKEQKLSVKDVKSLLQNGKRNLKTMMLTINQKNDEQRN